MLLKQIHMSSFSPLPHQKRKTKKKREASKTKRDYSMNGCKSKS